MPFEFPEGLAPEVYPLAWLVGSWRGEGVVKYPGVEETPFVHDVEFDHDGGPYLRYRSTLRVLEADVPETVPDEGEWPERDAATLDATAATMRQREAALHASYRREVVPYQDVQQTSALVVWRPRRKE